MSPIVHAVSRQRLCGYLPPGEGASLGMQLAGVANHPDAASPGDIRRYRQLAAGYVRQDLLLSPWRKDFAALADLAGRTAPHPPGFKAWLDKALPLLAKPEPTSPITPPDPLKATDQEMLDYILADPNTGHAFPGLLLLWQRGAAEAFLHGLKHFMERPAAGLAAPLLAWGALACGESLHGTSKGHDLARELLDQGPATFLGHALLARLHRNDPDKYRGHLEDGLNCEPQAAPLALQRKQAGAFPEPGPDVYKKTHICLYSWNKLDTLLRTLASLAGTRTHGAGITVLNNGSDQFAPEDLERGAAEAAPGLNVNYEHLPVNIGAPAARNWLLRLPRVKACRYAAFVDDDVLLPPDWLEQGLAALTGDPEACVAGPKGLAPGPMRRIQYVWRYFEEIGERRIRFTPNAPTLLDLGQYDLVRPSLTVMGCCHVLDTERLARLHVPDFDIRFSPSQVDDIEHDMQVWKAGGKVLYTGRMEVVHLQDTGGLNQDEAKLRASRTQAWANHIKLEGKFSPDEFEAMRDAVQKADDAAWAEAT